MGREKTLLLYENVIRKNVTMRGSLRSLVVHAAESFSWSSCSTTRFDRGRRELKRREVKGASKDARPGKKGKHAL